MCPEEEDGSAGGDEDGEQEEGDEMDEPLDEIPEDMGLSFLLCPVTGTEGQPAGEGAGEEEETAASRGWSARGWDPPPGRKELAAAALEQGCRCNPPVPSRALYETGFRHLTHTA